MNRPYTNTVTWNCIDCLADFIGCFFQSLQQEVIKSYYACECQNNMLARLLRWLGFPDIGVRHITYFAHVLFIFASTIVAGLLIYVVCSDVEYGILTGIKHWWK